MAHDVFISYSSKDKPTADAACAALEAQGIRCWIAPRDILPGSDWGETIVDAIHGSRALVLVFSANANLSQQIKREVERGANAGLPIVPFRIENVLPAKSLEYFLSTPHWLDAITPPLEQHLTYLAEVIRHILDDVPPPAASAIARNAGVLDRRGIIGAGIAGSALLVGLGYWVLRPSTPPSFVGRWTAEKMVLDPDTPNLFGSFAISAFVRSTIERQGLSGNLEVADLGQYKFNWSGADGGAVTADGSKLVFTSDYTHQQTALSLAIYNSDQATSFATQMGGQVGDSAIGLTAQNMDAVLMGRPSGSPDRGIGPLVGHWRSASGETGMLDKLTTSLDVTPEGRYSYRFDVAESGIWEATDGKWTRSAIGAAPVAGTYKFDDSNHVTCVSATGETVWKRVS